MTTLIKYGYLPEWAANQNVDLIGAAQTDILSEEADYLAAWLKNGQEGPMPWMHKYQSIRRDITELLPGAQSVVMIAMNYYSTRYPEIKRSGKISRYVTQVDYHTVLKKKLYTLLAELQKMYPGVVGRPFTDSAPVFEKAWAVRAGLGWIGKNSNVIHPRLGSWLFLGGMALTAEFDSYARPMKNYCGNCTRCLDACPAAAFPGPFRVDAGKCISAQTIENRDPLLSPETRLDGWIYGCDRCQDVCPWNDRFAKDTATEELLPAEQIHRLSVHNWLEMDNKTYQKTVKRTAMVRQKADGIRRNAVFILNEAGDGRDQNIQ